jgi:hypothetical protein
MPRLTPEQREAKQRARLAPFVPLLKETLDAPAWKALSHGARSLYVALKRFYNVNIHNNGRIFLSQRDAAEQLGSGLTQIARWFRELQHYGFIRMSRPGGLGVSGRGVAPHWRLTELGYMKELPTRDFLRWDGELFGNRKTESRSRNLERGVAENRNSGVPENTNGSELECSRKLERTLGCNRSRKPERNILTTPCDAPPPSGLPPSSDSETGHRSRS